MAREIWIRLKSVTFSVLLNQLTHPALLFKTILHLVGSPIPTRNTNILIFLLLFLIILLFVILVLFAALVLNTRTTLGHIYPTAIEQSRLKIIPSTPQCASIRHFLTNNSISTNLPLLSAIKLIERKSSWADQLFSFFWTLNSTWI